VSNPVRIVLADGHPLMLVGLVEVLSGEEGIAVVATTSDGRLLVQLVARERADLVILDPALPYLTAPVSVKRLREQSPEVAVILLCDDTRAEIDAGFDWGATSHIYRRIAPSDLAPIIRRVAAGTIYTPPIEPDPQTAIAQRLELSPRELEILTHLAQGATNKSIAAALWLTEQTVKFHLTNIYRKLRLKNRTDAVRFAHEHGLTHGLIHHLR
jgi:DNA-binding NarL/FixJ family response regulator